MDHTRNLIAAIRRSGAGFRPESHWSACFALALVAAMAGGTASRAATLTPVALGGYNANIQQNLVADGPSGNFTTPNGFATPFSIPASGPNFDQVTASTPLITTVGLSDVTDVFALLNAYSPVSGGLVGMLTFNFANGSLESFKLIGGSNVRDFFAGGFANTLTDPAAANAFTYPNTRGGGDTGNTSNGAVGTYVLDEQDFALGPIAVGQTLTSIVLTTTASSISTGNGTPILLGLTVEHQVAGTGGGSGDGGGGGGGGGTTKVPEPASLMLLGTGLLGMLGSRRRRSM